MRVIEVLVDILLVSTAAWIFLIEIRRQESSGLIEARVMTKIVAAGLACLALSLIFLRSYSILTVSVILTMVPLLLFYHVSKDRRQLETAVGIILDQIILSLRLGESHSRGLELGLERLPSRSQHLIRAYFRANSEPANLPSKLKQLRLTYRSCDHRGANHMGLFLELRKILEVERRFQQKKQTVTSQARAQLVVIGIIYVGLLVLSFSTVQDLHQRPMVPLSALMFGTGCYLFWLQLRSFRWNL
jgi:Flp pilus assembly protein TadB